MKRTRKQIESDHNNCVWEKRKEVAEIKRQIDRGYDYWLVRECARFQTELLDFQASASQSCNKQGSGSGNDVAGM